MLVSCLGAYDADPAVTYGQAVSAHIYPLVPLACVWSCQVHSVACLLQVASPDCVLSVEQLVALLQKDSKIA